MIESDVRLQGRRHLQAADGDDVAGARNVDVGAVVGVHLHQPPYPLLVAFAGAQREGSFLQHAAADSEPRSAWEDGKPHHPPTKPEPVKFLR